MEHGIEARRRFGFRADGIDTGIGATSFRKL
jgi:hypothetical protein